jgi:hypothetical protein
MTIVDPSDVTFRVIFANRFNELRIVEFSILLRMMLGLAPVLFGLLTEHSPITARLSEHK